MLRSFGERYRKELFESIEPFWLRHSLDRKHGGYFTCLDRFGEVYDDRKYVWLQGRAVWTFCKLYNEIERRSEWLDAARLGMDFLRKYARDSQGRCYFSLARSGEPVFYQRKPYGAAFLTLALVEYSKATGDRQCHSEAIDLFRNIESWVRDPSLLGRPTLTGQHAVSKLADVMILAMLALEMLEIDNDPRYDELLGECLLGAMKHLDSSRSILLETVSTDGSLLLDSPDGRVFNPGHSIEVAWFLLHVLRRRPDPILQKKVLDIMAGTLEFGWDQEYGGLYYFMDVEGKPMLPLESFMKLWWPHTEAIYGVILAYTITGDSYWLGWLNRLDNYVFQHFADAAHGEWFGYCDRHGNLTNSCKGNNYKGFYHVPRFLLFSAREIENFEGR